MKITEIKWIDSKKYLCQQDSEIWEVYCGNLFSKKDGKAVNINTVYNLQTISLLEFESVPDAKSCEIFIFPSERSMIDVETAC